jgi:Leucine-rich repeat (LRR) protein
MLVASDLITAKKHADTVEELHLSGAGLVELPPYVFDMPKLRVLDISNNQIPESELRLGGMTQLRFLSLEKMGLRKLPADVFALESLENLRISQNDLYFLPDDLAELKSLRVLEAGRCNLDSYPVSLCQFPALESLHLSGNELTFIPSAIKGLHRLSFLNISDNKIFRLPSELALLSKLKDVLLDNNKLQLGYDSALADDLRRFLAQTADGKLSPDRRQVFLEVLLSDMSSLIKRPAADVLQALDAPQAEVRNRASEVLYPVLSDPFSDSTPASICLLGRMPGLHKSRITQKLRELGIVLRSKPLGDSCVVIAGERPGKRLATAFERGCKVGVEGHLADFLAHEDGQYLSAGKGSENPMVGNVLQMLRSGNIESIQLALTLMEAGGIPGDALSELVGLSLFGRGNKTVVREFLQVHGSKRINHYLEVMRRTASPADGKMKFHEQEMLEMTLRHPELDRRIVLRHALQGGQTDQLGYAQLLEMPDPVQEELMPLLLSGHVLSFFMMGLRRFPQTCMTLPGLRSLILGRNEIEELPPDIGQMKNLQSLNLSENHLRELPESFCELSALESLTLDGNRFHEFPEAFGQMKSLENLVLANNPLERLPEAFTQSDTLKYLNLSQAFRGDVPEMVSRIPGLVSLNLEDCGIEDLDEWKPVWHRMESLVLPHNPLEHIPEWIGELKQLHSLDLSHCPANRLPESLRGADLLEQIGLPIAKNLDWDQVGEILNALPKLKRVYYDRSASPGIISSLARRRRHVQFKGYQLKK